MCGYDPFYWYDWQLDRQCADEFGFDNLDDFYDYVYEQNRDTRALRH